MFGSKPVASITTADVARFRAALLAPHPQRSFVEVAAPHDYIANERGNPVYALAVVFAAYTGVRVAELQGLQVQDITLSDIPGTVGSLRVTRTKKKARAVSEGDDTEMPEPLVWIEGTPKSDASTDRTIPLAPWLADDMRDYLTRIHPFAGKKRIAHAPLFPGKRTRAGKSAASVEDFDWAKPIVVDNSGGQRLPQLLPARMQGVRPWERSLLRSEAHVRHASPERGEHYMQVSKWLGHSSFVLTLTTYADYIREDDTAAPNFARPVAKLPGKVVSLERKAN